MMTVIVKRARVSTDSRASMVRSAASLIRSRGVSATSFSDVLADSGAPRGSIYHHFPDGKAQLAEDAIQWTSERLLTHLRAGAPAAPWLASNRSFPCGPQGVWASLAPAASWWAAAGLVRVPGRRDWWRSGGWRF